jgi:hypothetical protein
MKSHGSGVAIGFLVLALALGGAAFALGKATASGDETTSPQQAEGIEVGGTARPPKLASASAIPPLRAPRPEPESSTGSTTGSAPSDTSGGTTNSNPGGTTNSNPGGTTNSNPGGTNDNPGGTSGSHGNSEF